MTLFVRTLGVLLRLGRGPRLGPLDESRLTLRVLPGDLDVNVHPNNGRYLSLMDLGRLDLIGRMGVLRPILRRRWRPMVGSVTIRFRRSLAPWQRFQLTSRLLAWDERWFYLEQRFLARGELAAVALVRAVFLDRQGRVEPRRVVEALLPGVESPPLPAGVAEWRQAESLLYESLDTASVRDASS